MASVFIPAILIHSIVFSLVQHRPTVLTAPQTAGPNTPGKQKISANAELDNLYANAKRFANSFSRITCEESIHSEQNSTAGGFRPQPIHWKMDTEGEFTVTRSEGGVAGFKDSRTFKKQDGKSVSPGKTITLPFNLSDAFAPAIVTYLAPERRACLGFSFASTRIDFKALPRKGGNGTCADVAPDARGYIVFDPVTHTVSHFERTVPLEAGRSGGFAPFAAVDYQPYGLDGSLYMIPTRIVGTRTDRGINYSFQGSYSNCLLFKPKVTIRDSQGNEIKGPQ